MPLYSPTISLLRFDFGLASLASIPALWDIVFCYAAAGCLKTILQLTHDRLLCSTNAFLYGYIF
ncbi:hypothetical protein Hanom_Chr16g01495941 [Helianthus anomalus]